MLQSIVIIITNTYNCVCNVCMSIFCLQSFSLMTGIFAYIYSVFCANEISGKMGFLFKGQKTFTLKNIKTTEH